MREFINLMEFSGPALDQALEKRVLDLMWNDRHSDSSTHYYVRMEMGIDDEDDDEVDDSTPEYRKAFDSVFSDRISDAYYNIEHKFKGETLPIYRVITAPRTWTPDPNKGPGIYWSWDRNAADAHWGEFNGYNIKWLLTAEVTSRPIDWETTLVMNASFSYEDEKEIRLSYDNNLEYEWEPLNRNAR